MDTPIPRTFLTAFRPRADGRRSMATRLLCGPRVTRSRPGGKERHQCISGSGSLCSPSVGLHLQSWVVPDETHRANDSGLDPSGTSDSFVDDCGGESLPDSPLALR
jgi:hypothetical protein